MSSFASSIHMMGSSLVISHNGTCNIAADESRLVLVLPIPKRVIFFEVERVVRKLRISSFVNNYKNRRKVLPIPKLVIFFRSRKGGWNNSVCRIAKWLLSNSAVCSIAKWLL